MAAAVAHGLAQTYLDKPWANAYSLSFLPDAVKAAPPTSSVQGGDDPVELGISLPVEEWGESGIGVGVDAGDAREGVPAKRKSEDEATSDDHREVPTSETGTGRRRHLSPLPVFPQNSYEVENRRKGMPHLNRPYPLPQPQNRPTSARPCSPIPPKSPPSSAGLVEDSQGFDFVSSAATGERSHKRRRSTASRGTNRDRPPESPFLTNEMLFPSLRDLKFQDYQPLLLDKPVTPVWSAALYELLLQFFRFCEPCESWAKDPTQLSVGAGLPSIVRKVLRYQPNHRAIQAIYTPAVAPGYDALGQRLKYKFRAMRDVMRWLLDDRLLKVDTVAHLVRYAPLPLHILGASRTMFAPIPTLTDVCSQSASLPV